MKAMMPNAAAAKAMKVTFTVLLMSSLLRNILMTTNNADPITRFINIHMGNIPAKLALRYPMVLLIAIASRAANTKAHIK